MKILAVVLLLAGCNLAPSRAEWDAANFGQKPDAKAMTEDWIHEVFIDPDSAMVYEITEPQRVCFHPGSIRSKTYGWLWFVDVNSKNKFGGYVGRQTHRIYRRYMSGVTDGSEVAWAHLNADDTPGWGAVQWYFYGPSD